MAATRARHTLRLFHPPESVSRFVDEARIPFSLECADKLYEGNRIVRDADPTNRGGLQRGNGRDAFLRTTGRGRVAQVVSTRRPAVVRVKFGRRMVVCGPDDDMILV